MDDDLDLFRKEVLQQRVHRHLGVVRIPIPIITKITGYGALLIVLLLSSFIYWAKFREQIVVRGYVDVAEGIVRVLSPRDGILSAMKVVEGERVYKGQILALITRSDGSLFRNHELQLNQKRDNLKREYLITVSNYHAVNNLAKKHFVSLVQLKQAETKVLKLKSLLNEVEYQLQVVRAHHEQVIKAPEAGVVTNIMYRSGQALAPGQMMLQLIPLHRELIARLYIPVRHIGFLKRGQTVSLKYDAYPAQRFGFYPGTIQEINQTILTDEEELKPIHIQEPYYKIKVRLDKPYIVAKGHPMSLIHGMTLTAIVKGEQKTIWQWALALDPLYRYSEGVVS